MKAEKKVDHFSGQKVLMVGLGVHGGGAATVQWLLRHGARVRVTDKKNRRELAHSLHRLYRLPIEWRLGQENIRDVSWADWLVQNPGVPNDNQLIRAAKKANKPIHNEAGLFLDWTKSQTIAVTGTRGKTTTTLLIAHILRAANVPALAAGNFRDVPLLQVVDRLTARHWAVTELSSFQLEGLAAIRRGPQIAVWTNLHVDHLNRYPSLQAYINAKTNILRYQKPTDLAILNADSAAIRRATRKAVATIIWFTTSSRPVGTWSVFIRQGWVEEVRHGRRRKIVAVATMPLPGVHQRQNLLAAIGACLAVGVKPSNIRRALPSFRSLPHRQAVIRVWRGHRWINDSAATSPEGALAAMQTFPRAVYIIGGTDKRLEFTTFVNHLVRRRPKVVFLPGSATDRIVLGLKRKKYSKPLIIASSMTEAVQRSIELAKSGDDIVLTPGAASFGLFRHEFDRGDRFIRAVKALR